LAINAGVDILLFGNQLAHQNLGKLLDVIYKQVKAKKIPLSRIIESNARITSLLHQFNKSDAIISKPIDFTPNRFELSRQYIQEHYDLNVTDITIDPKVIVLHWTAVMDVNDSFNRLKADELYTDRKDISSASLLNVSAHFLVDRDGSIYQLMPQNWMARHVIGLNYCSIGIENVGGENNDKEDLTQAQVDANVALVRYLKRQYPGIEYLIGHHEYEAMEQTPLWLERDAQYRTVKKDPGERFMKRVRERVRALELKNAPEAN
jgi:beta-N-acetylhexosaminidase